MQHARAYNKLQLSDVYKNLFPWRNSDEFFHVIKETIAYRSDDNSLIAICKPLGVGTYSPNDKNLSKQNQDRFLYKSIQPTRYCVADILKPLTDEFNSKEPYQVLKGIDRYMSGLVLLSNNLKTHRARFISALSGSRCAKMPPYGFRAITSGYPLLKSNKIFETVGIELVEVDELGDYKEPIIVPSPSAKFRNKYERDKTTFQAELEIKKVNTEVSVALVDLYVSKLIYDIPRCYISSKTSFILGDVRFSKRIKEILGKQIQISAFRSSHSHDDYEPLNCKLRNLLGVNRNASIPLMLDLHAIRLKSFERSKTGKRDLIIRSNQLPIHFEMTARRLNLLS